MNMKNSCPHGQLFFGAPEGTRAHTPLVRGPKGDVTSVKGLFKDAFVCELNNHADALIISSLIYQHITIDEMSDETMHMPMPKLVLK